MNIISRKKAIIIVSICAIEIIYAICNIRKSLCYRPDQYMPLQAWILLKAITETLIVLATMHYQVVALVVLSGVYMCIIIIGMVMFWSQCLVGGDDTGTVVAALSIFMGCILGSLDLEIITAVFSAGDEEHDYVPV
jgi:hypothetical protein